jgi:hypothetical protein
MRARAFTAAAIVAGAIAISGCSPAASPSPTPPPDAASLLTAAGKATYPTKLEMTFGGSFTSAGATTNLPDKMLVVDVDTAAGAGVVHLAVPTSLLGAGAAPQLAALGVTGDTLALDVLFDGKALYAKSPLLPSLMSQLSLLGGATPLPSITADTWAMLVDEATMKEITSSAKTAVSSAAPVASANTADMKAQLEQAGVTVALGPQTTGPGGPANDIKLTIDPVKLKAYAEANADKLPSNTASQLANLDSLTAFSADAIVDVATSRLEQVTLSAAGKQNGADMSFTFKMGIAEAPAGTSFSAPSGAVDVPIVKMLTPFLSSMFAGGLPGASTQP